MKTEMTEMRELTTDELNLVTGGQDMAPGGVGSQVGNAAIHLIYSVPVVGSIIQTGVSAALGFADLYKSLS